MKTTKTTVALGLAKAFQNQQRPEHVTACELVEAPVSEQRYLRITWDAAKLGGTGKALVMIARPDCQPNIEVAERTDLITVADIAC